MEEKITLTAESYGTKVTVEAPAGSSTEEMCNAFLTLMLGLTYQYDNVIETMRSFSQELIDVREMDLDTVRGE